MTKQGYKYLLPHLKGETLSVCNKKSTSNPQINILSKDAFSKSTTDVIKHSEYPVSVTTVLKKILPPTKPQVSYETAERAAQRVTEDPKLQKALIELSQKEAIVIRTKNDAIPILHGQFDSLANKENVR